MSKQSIKATIDANIKQNGVQAITGPVMNSVLNQMVDNLAEEASTTEKLTELILKTDVYEAMHYALSGNLYYYENNGVIVNTSTDTCKSYVYESGGVKTILITLTTVNTSREGFSVICTDYGHNILKKSIKTSSGTHTNIKIDLPENTYYIYVNTAKGTPFSVKKKWHDKGYEILDTEFVNGRYNSYGEVFDSQVSVRSQRLWVENILCAFPVNLECEITRLVNGKREIEIYSNPFFIRNNKDFITLVFRYKDGKTIQDDWNVIKKDVYLYVGDTKSDDYDITICPCDGKDADKSRADIVLNGDNDTSIIQAVWGSEYSIKCLLYSGNYSITSIHSTKYDKPCAFSTFEKKAEGIRSIEFYGCRSGRNKMLNDFAIFNVTKALYDSINQETSIFMTPRAGAEETTTETYNTIVFFKDIGVCGYGIEKPIVFLDFKEAGSSYVEGCDINAIGAKGIQQKIGLFDFGSVPNELLTGIRVGHGSNNGWHNGMKRNLVIYMNTGYSICGEHFIIEDCLAHHNFVGFAFGDRATRPEYEHPNVMVGCSIEGCKRLMVLDRHGRGDLSVPNTLICVGLSTELSFYDPELKRRVSTLPILEKATTKYRGRIEADWINEEYPNSVFESGSGTKMQEILHTVAGTLVNGVLINR